MFSGIIQAVVPIHTIYESTNFKTYTIILPTHLLSNLKIGYSISNNGCCLTVIAMQHNLVSFNLIHETLKLTNMGMLKSGDLINIERSLSFHSEIGGHLMSGHVDCTGKIIKIITSENNKIIWFNIKKKYLKKYILHQGSIGVDGVSLTVSRIFNDYIRICLTPYTAIQTTLGSKKIGNVVNIEVDIIIKSVINSFERTLSIVNLKK
ncbi:riboflavin synthase subunit alpha [Blochmannia endosymbiont of Camponotus sp. C-003]|uniref:riboflavin synthase subunit alpha n=1 Tax=unclassified Candidatus Blochmanniella TaxID=711328 RepID=UPI0020251D50|nr:MULTISPECIES: riboflavin synthase subunit alpha [unclassified Candidatus Blochmannia]URJ23450.1 riboflavin synthase subunit alpha [Blochmannia endosymbiont of Camponotus sp. C-003]URJ28922.1 riboflavin synthase subunit alpha [Blochmannia endosymbiont of Camponotus sp. C-046]